jgi:hypothetical protein
MNRTTFASIAAVVSLVNGIPGLIAPVALASLYGVTLDSQGALAAQLLAGSYIGYGVMNWTTRRCTDAALCRGIDAGNLVAWAIGAVIWIYAASTGMSNAVGWFGAGLAVVFTLGWAYFLMADRTVAPRVVRVAPR